MPSQLWKTSKLVSLSRDLGLRHLSNSIVAFSGHNKWSKIKQKKGVMDAQKGAIYGKANRDIVLAARTGGSADPVKNLALAAAIRWAKEQDVPKENIEKALAKATKGKDQGGEHLTYEALAFGSVGIIIECLTNNSNRTIHSLREILNTHNARFAPVKFMFQRMGSVKVLLNPEGSESQAEVLVDTALEAGAEDFEQSPSGDGMAEIEFSFLCQPPDLTKLTNAVTSLHPPHKLMSSELIYTPLEAVDCSDEIQGGLATLIEDLEENEDTLRVWSSPSP